MPDLELLASRLGSAGLLEKPVCGFTKQEVDLLCRSVLEAYGEPLLPGTGETMFFCRYGQRVKWWMHLQECAAAERRRAVRTRSPAR